MNSISPSNFTFWCDQWDRSCGGFCLEQNCPREHVWDMPLNNTRWELDCYDLKKESRRWQKQKYYLSFQGCLKITRFLWTLSQSVVFLQGILALTYFPRNQNIIVVIFFLESRNVCELLSERHKQASLKLGAIGIWMLIQIISKYPFQQKCSRWKSGISSHFWHRSIWTRKHIIYPWQGEASCLTSLKQLNFWGHSLTFSEETASHSKSIREATSVHCLIWFNKRLFLFILVQWLWNFKE